MDELFDRGIEEFNRGEYFEAHDTWEELWRDTRSEQRLFYQGLIQAAVGLYHLSCRNLNGAERQLGKAIEKLGRYPSAHHGIDTQGLIEALRIHAAEVGRRKLGESDPGAGAAPPAIRRV